MTVLVVVVGGWVRDGDGPDGGVGDGHGDGERDGRGCACSILGEIFPEGKFMCPAQLSGAQHSFPGAQHSFVGVQHSFPGAQHSCLYAQHSL